VSYGSDRVANLAWTDMRDFVPEEDGYAQSIYVARLYERRIDQTVDESSALVGIWLVSLSRLARRMRRWGGNMHRNKLALVRRSLIPLAGLAILGAVLATPASAARALHLAFVQQPTHITAGQVITPAVTVQVLDRSNSVVTNKVFPITVALGTNAGGGSLFGTKTVNTVAGVATFADLTIDEAGNGYTLVATNPDSMPAGSAGFNVTGFATQCATSPCGLKTGNTSASNPTNGNASVPVSACGAAVCPFLSQDIISPAQCGPQACLNNAGVAVFPPANATGVVTFVLENYYTPNSGGIGNRPVYLVKPDGTVITLPKCGNPPGNEACVLVDSAIKGSLVRTVVQFPADDPIVQK
jgi:hypothetical protein